MKQSTAVDYHRLLLPPLLFLAHFIVQIIPLFASVFLTFHNRRSHSGNIVNAMRNSDDSSCSCGLCSPSIVKFCRDSDSDSEINNSTFSIGEDFFEDFDNNEFVDAIVSSLHEDKIEDPEDSYSRKDFFEISQKCKVLHGSQNSQTPPTIKESPEVKFSAFGSAHNGFFGQLRKFNGDTTSKIFCHQTTQEDAKKTIFGDQSTEADAKKTNSIGTQVEENDLVTRKLQFCDQSIQCDIITQDRLNLCKDKEVEEDECQRKEETCSVVPLNGVLLLSKSKNIEKLDSFEAMKKGKLSESENYLIVEEEKSKSRNGLMDFLARDQIGELLLNIAMSSTATRTWEIEEKEESLPSSNEPEEIKQLHIEGGFDGFETREEGELSSHSDSDYSIIKESRNKTKEEVVRELATAVKEEIRKMREEAENNRNKDILILNECRTNLLMEIEKEQPTLLEKHIKNNEDHSNNCKKNSKLENEVLKTDILCGKIPMNLFAYDDILERKKSEEASPSKGIVSFSSFLSSLAKDNLFNNHSSDASDSDETKKGSLEDDIVLGSKRQFSLVAYGNSPEDEDTKRKCSFDINCNSTFLLKTPPVYHLPTIRKKEMIGWRSGPKHRLQLK